MRTPPDLDIRPLTDNPSWNDRRRFRAEAAAGEHGDDVAAPSFGERRATGIAVTLIVVMVAALPLSVLVDDPVARVAGTAMLGAFIVVVAGLEIATRRTSWRGIVDRRLRIARFAAANRATHEAQGTLTRPRAGHVFHEGRNRRHRDLVRFPAPAAFHVADYEFDTDANEPDMSHVDHGYVVFRLRESGPRTVIGRGDVNRWGPSELRRHEPSALANGWSIVSRDPEHALLGRMVTPGLLADVARLGSSAHVEIVGDELYVHVSARLPLGSPRLWRTVDAIRRRLAAHLADVGPLDERVSTARGENG